MMIVVSDTSPISNLLQIGDLDLLRLLFEEIVIPHDVFLEICKVKEQAEILANQDWITPVGISDTALKDKLLKDLDKGEAEAIVLAIELNADYLLMDETKGRAIAESYNVKVIGILGVLLQAKEKGFISEVKPHLDKLVNEAGFWLNPNIIKKVLELAKE
jgi:predicted nucleic acid-binding protein